MIVERLDQMSRISSVASCGVFYIMIDTTQSNKSLSETDDYLLDEVRLPSFPGELIISAYHRLILSWLRMVWIGR
jgi:hypothetical protein